MSMESTPDAYEGLVILHHAKEDCDGPPCCFHGPSLHSMVEEPMHLRSDLAAMGMPLIERICRKHGTGHPDPDSVAWLEKHGPPGARGSWGVHGCCGCCSKLERPES